MKKYYTRISDKILEKKLKTFGAVCVTGPKGCGKSTTAKQKAKSIVEFQDEDKREGYISVVNSEPSRILIGEKPRLFDEWQDAPKIWGAIRKSVDDEQKQGLYILTGSSSQNVNTTHTGTFRISEMKMYPMSLYETKESNGEVSLNEIINDSSSFKGCHSSLTISELIYAICRGGWPMTLNLDDREAKLDIVKDLCNQICKKDISNIDGKNRNPIWAQKILRSYARNICTLATQNTIYKDVCNETGISENTYYDYVEALEKLYIIENIDAWAPQIRSKTAIRSTNKKNFIDPSIAVGILSLNPDYFNTDFNTLGFLFESLCMRDLKVYSSINDGYISYYHDRYGLEADAVLHLAGGSYALIEIKLSDRYVDEGAKNLCNIEKLIIKHNNENNGNQIKLPNAKIVITGGEYGYRRDDGVIVIPIGCLRD